MAKRMHKGTMPRISLSYRCARRNDAKVVRADEGKFTTVSGYMHRFYPAPAWCSVPNYKGNRHQRRRLNNKKVQAAMLLEMQRKLFEQAHIQRNLGLSVAA